MGKWQVRMEAGFYHKNESCQMLQSLGKRTAAKKLADMASKVDHG